LRIVRKLSRKRFQGALLYEYDRFFIPVPAKARDLVRPWTGRDVKIHIHPLSYGFAILVTGGDSIYLVPPGGGIRVAPRLKFEMLMREMESNLR